MSWLKNVFRGQGPTADTGDGPSLAAEDPSVVTENTAREPNDGDDSVATDPLIAALLRKDYDYNAHAEAYDRLVELCNGKDQRMIDLLMAALNLKETNARVVIFDFLESIPLSTLEKISDSRLTDVLIGALDDQNNRVRCDAVLVLASLKPSEAVDPLIAHISDENINHGFVAYCLGEIGDPRAAPHLLPLLRSRWGEGRAQSAAALGKLRYSEAVSDLTALLDDPEQLVRDKAAAALKALSDDGNQKAVERNSNGDAGELGSDLETEEAQPAERTDAGAGDVRALPSSDESLGPETLVTALRQVMGRHSGEVPLDSGINILRFPAGRESHYRLSLKLTERLKAEGVYPELHVYALRAVFPPASFARLIVISGSADATSRLPDVYFTRQAEEFVAAECAGNWDALNLASSICNIEPPGTGMSLDVEDFNRDLARHLGEIESGAYEIERVLA